MDYGKIYKYFRYFDRIRNLFVNIEIILYLELLFFYEL